MRGDITTLEVDAIVNAANSQLLPGSGVSGAIHAAGGPTIAEECREIVERQGPVPTGEAVITTAGRLSARWVVHTVGPIWGHADPEAQDRQLGSCYRASLRLAAEHGARTIALPNVSVGIYGYPRDRAARVAIDATRAALAEPGCERLDEVVFCCFEPENLALYERLLGDPA